MDIALYTVKSVASILSDPILMVSWAFFIFLLYKQNKKTTAMQKMMLGESINSPVELTASQVAIGILAGVFGSIILSYLGVMFDENSSILLIFFISILFMFASPRFICFAYSGAALGGASIILSEISSTLNIPNLDFLKIDVVALMTLVGVLHIVEGVLVMLDGSRGAIPVFTSKDGRVIGGFALKRYWLLPLTLLFVSVSSNIVGGDKLSQPQWWPLVHSSIPMSILSKSVLLFSVILGGLGYSSVTFTRNKREKAAISGISILLYGIILSFVAQIAHYGFLASLAVVIFAPLAHEAMLRFGKNLEAKGAPKYVSDEEGIVVLDVAPDAPADKMGIKSGDKILSINGRSLSIEENFLKLISESSNFISILIKRPSGVQEELTYNSLGDNKRLGIVFVPYNIVNAEGETFQDMLNKMKDKDDK